MAWQLIYTSAPRLLEAGRSGFGTIARHRAIPPLLAGAVERVSQFSRLPGLAEHRIIYSHRHISAGGARYHVISRICDAGADYTGRTNHIAHHLIIESREAAAAAVSPADVMLSFPWKSRWEENPRYFESAEEIPLASIPRSIRLPAKWWERMTGNARYAALPLEPEVSRGCYLVYAGDMQRDPRQQTAILLFGESLLVAAERSWSIPFTTNFQPSDESSDFLWSGVWADSPLRAQIEQSGRVVFHLESGIAVKKGTEGTAPVPRSPMADFAQTGRSAAVPVVTPKTALIPEIISGGALRAVTAKPSLLQPREPSLSPSLPASYSGERMPLPSHSSPARGMKFPWVLLVCLLSGIMILSAAGFFIAKKWRQGGDLATRIADELKSVPGRKDTDAANLLAQTGNGRSREEVEAIAKSAQHLALNWIDDLKTTEGNKDLEIRQDIKDLQSYNVTQPESIPDLVKLVQGWLGLRDNVLRGKITDEKSYDGCASIARAIMQDTSVDLTPVRDALLQKNANMRAVFLLDSLNINPTPKQKLAWYLEKKDAILNDLKNVQITDSDLNEHLDTLDSILTLWAALDKSLRDNKPTDELAKDHFHESDRVPAWLKVAVNDILTPKPNAIASVSPLPAPPSDEHILQTVAPPPTIEGAVINGSKSIYIVIGDEGLAGLPLPFDPRNLSKLTLVVNGNPPVELELLKDGNIYFKKEKSWFQALAYKLQHIPSLFGDREIQPSPPYALKGASRQDAPGIEKDFEIRVIAASSSGSQALLQFQGGLMLSKTGSAYVITYDKGFEKLAANLVFPLDAKLKTPPNFDPRNNDPMQFNFSNYRADISKLMNELESRKAELDSLAAASKPQTNSSKDPAKDTRDEIRNQLDELKKKLKTDSIRKHLPSDDLSAAEIIRDLTNLTRAPDDLRKDKERNNFNEDVTSLNEAIGVIQKLNANFGPQPPVDEAAQKKNRKELEDLNKSPLLNSKLPGGSYRIVVGEFPSETTIAEFDIPNSEEIHK